MMNQLAAVWQDMVICGVTPGEGVNSLYTHPCGYADLIKLFQAVISNMVVLATIFVTITLMWVGFKLLTSGGDSNAMKEAKEMFRKIIIGFIWIIAAWTVVYTITSVLLKDGYSLLTPR